MDLAAYLATHLDTQRIRASVAFGSLLCDGLGNSVQTGLGTDPALDLDLIITFTPRQPAPAATE